MRRILIAAVATLALSSGCKSEAQTQAEARAVAAAAEQARREQARASLMATPASFIELSEPRFFDKGIINSYRELTQLTALNRSEFAVNDLHGELELVDSTDNAVAVIPFSIKGSLPAGDTKTFSKSAGTLTGATVQTDASRYRMRVTRLAIVGSP